MSGKNNTYDLFEGKSFSDIVKVSKKPSSKVISKPSNIKSVRKKEIVIKSSRRRKGPHPPPGKWWWKDDKGKFIAAAGILIFDDEGMWLVAEKSRKNDGGVEYTDFGGKYDWNDGDIYATIPREFREECYNTDELSYSLIKRLVTSPSTEKKFVYRMNKGKYLCLIVHRSLLPPLKLSDLEVKIARDRVIASNPFCHDSMYRTVGIKFIPFKEIENYKTQLSYRLSTILKFSQLNKKIPNKKNR